MDTNTLIAVLAIVVGVIVVAFLIIRFQRSRGLQKHYGSEYNRIAEELGGKHKAEVELQHRQKRVAEMAIQPLSVADRSRYLTAWTQVQADFVDDPKGAASRADALLGDVMKARGYPVSDFDQRAADLSVDHPRVVENYRAGHDIALRHARGEASTEDLRQAMIHYKSLFEELVDDQTNELKRRRS